MSSENNHLNRLQREIMCFIDNWVKTEKVPIPRKKIITEMAKLGKKRYNILNSLHVLLTKGWIRRSFTHSNKTSYVQLRGLNV